MNIKKFAFLVFALAIVVDAFAVTLPFTVKAPAWKLLARSDKNVYIRKTPSTSAPLMLWATDGEDGESDAIIWGKQGGRHNYEPVTLNGFCAPVIEQRNGWLHLKNVGGHGLDGWVSAKYCQTSAPLPFDRKDANLRRVEDDFFVYMMSDGYLNEVIFYVGKFVGNVLVCPYAFSSVYGYNSEIKEPEYSDGRLFFGPAQTDDMGMPRLETFSAGTLSRIVELATRLPSTKYILTDNFGVSVY